jgi:hypothetical protein
MENYYDTSEQRTPNGHMAAADADNLFDVILAEYAHEPASEVKICDRLRFAGLYWVTIKQVQALTGLTSVYIRRRTQEGKWFKMYDDAGRVVIGIMEVREYLANKEAHHGTAYIVYLSDAELAQFKVAFPGKAIAPRYDPEKARKYRLRKAAEAERNGVKSGRLRL